MIRKRIFVSSLLIAAVIMTPLSTLHAADPVSVGAIFPLSGKFASFGNRALQGVELALERYNSSEAGKKRAVRLLIKDSKGNPKIAEKAVSELNMDGTDVIVGPILSITADAAAKKAQDLKIPIITMTQKEGITGIGNWVFRNGLTNAAQVKGLVDYASRQGVKRVAILYPDNPFGRELTGIFAAEFAKVSGEVVASKDYKEGQTDFGPEIKALVGTDFLEKMRAYNEEREKGFREAEKPKDMPSPQSEEEPVEEMERPAPDFEAIFIPDYAERVGLIIPQLAYYDVKDVKLMGVSGWNSPKLINMAGDFLSDNVMVVDGFFSGSPRPHVIDFVGAYRKTFDEEPGTIEALAYDTTGILLSLIPEGGDSREGLRNAILKIKDYQGVSGNITFSGRDAERSFYCLTVNRGVMEEVADR